MERVCCTARPSASGSRLAAPRSGWARRRCSPTQVQPHAPVYQRLAAVCSSSSSDGGGSGGGSNGSLPPFAAALLSAVQVLAALQLSLAAPALADGGDFTLSTRSGTEAAEDNYFETVPQGLSSADSSTSPRLGSLLEGPKGKQIQQCTRKCVPTCIRGGQGSPGLGPMSMRKELVVFKEGYRSRKYCLSECTQVCALTINAPPPAAAGK